MEPQEYLSLHPQMTSEFFEEANKKEVNIGTDDHEHRLRQVEQPERARNVSTDWRMEIRGNFHQYK